MNEYGPSFKRVTLERMTFGISQMVDRHILEDFQGPREIQVTEYMARNLAVQMRQYIYGRQHEKKSVTFPATWRDQAKEAFYKWLGWPGGGHWPWGAVLLSRRWPVRYRTIELDPKELYPLIAMPDKNPVMHIAMLDQISVKDNPFW